MEGKYRCGGGAMKNRVVVINQGVTKKELIDGLCCFGPLIPLVW